MPLPAVPRAAVDRSRFGPGPTGRSTGVSSIGPTGAYLAQLEYLFRPYVAALNPTAAMTVMGRLTLQNDSGQAVSESIFAQGYTSLDNRIALTLGFADRTRATVFVATAATTLVNGSTPVGSFPASSDRHIWWGLWFDGTGGSNITRCNVDLDAVLDLVPSFSGAVPAALRTGVAVYTPGVPTQFGRWFGQSSRPWSGPISDLMLFNYKVADADRSAIYASATPRATALALTTPPVAYWTCDEETGDQCFDSVGGNSLSIVKEPIGTPPAWRQTYDGPRAAYRANTATRKFYSWPGAFAAGGTKVMCAHDSRTVGSGGNEPGQAANVYSYRVGLHAWLKILGRNVDFVGPNSSGPTYLNDLLHDGVSGRAAETYAGVVAADVAAHDPEILITFGVINDIAALGRTAAQCITNMTNVVNNALGAKPGLLIWWVDEPPSTNAAQQATVDEYNSLIDAAITAIGNPNVRRSYAGTRHDPRGNFDANHPMLGGYDTLAYILARDIESFCAAA